jgi:hypothetical protein
MNRRSPIALAACLLVATSLTGCALLRRGNDEPRPRPTDELAADTNAMFRQLWVAQRVDQYVTQGVPAGIAQTRANSDFEQQFPYALPNPR